MKRRGSDPHVTTSNSSALEGLRTQLYYRHDTRASVVRNGWNIEVDSAVCMLLTLVNSAYISSIFPCALGECARSKSLLLSQYQDTLKL